MAAGMIAHACGGCTRLFYPTPGDDAAPLRCDAVIVALGDDGEYTRQRALDEGKARAERHYSKNRRDRFVPDDRIDNDQQSVGAEFAVCIVLGVRWTGGPLLDTFVGDAGGYQVRWSRTRRLMIYPENVGKYVFVTGRMPVFTLRGWIDAAEAMQRERWRTDLRLPAFVVDQDELHDLRRLPERRRALGIDEPVQATYDDVPE
jgi:hypothetical protein